MVTHANTRKSFSSALNSASPATVEEAALRSYGSGLPIGIAQDGSPLNLASFNKRACLGITGRVGAGKTVVVGSAMETMQRLGFEVLHCRYSASGYNQFQTNRTFNGVGASATESATEYVADLVTGRTNAKTGTFYPVALVIDQYDKLAAEIEDTTKWLRFVTNLEEIASRGINCNVSLVLASQEFPERLLPGQSHEFFDQTITMGARGADSPFASDSAAGVGAYTTHDSTTWFRSYVPSGAPNDKSVAPLYEPLKMTLSRRLPTDGLKPD